MHSKLFKSSYWRYEFLHNKHIQLNTRFLNFFVLSNKWSGHLVFLSSKSLFLAQARSLKYLAFIEPNFLSLGRFFLFLVTWTFLETLKIAALIGVFFYLADSINSVEQVRIHLLFNFKLEKHDQNSNVVGILKENCPWKLEKI